MNGQTSADDAAERVRFDLTYRRERGRRLFQPSGLSGHDIHNAYRRGGWSNGEWSAEFPDWDDDSVDWVREFFTVAISEAVHEALEWFRVDGAPLLDPHWKHEETLMQMSAEFAHALYALAPSPNLARSLQADPVTRLLTEEIAEGVVASGSRPHCPAPDGFAPL